MHECDQITVFNLFRCILNMAGNGAVGGKWHDSWIALLNTMSYSVLNSSPQIHRKTPFFHCFPDLTPRSPPTSVLYLYTFCKNNISLVFAFVVTQSARSSSAVPLRVSGASVPHIVAHFCYRFLTRCGFPLLDLHCPTCSGRYFQTCHDSS
jgi:hypothetical protein